MLLRLRYVIVFCSAGNEVFHASLFIHVIRQSVSWLDIFIGLGVLYCVVISINLSKFHCVSYNTLTPKSNIVRTTSHERQDEQDD